MNIIYIALAFLAGVLVAWFIIKKIKGGKLSDLNKKAGERKEARKVKILKLIKKAPNGRVRNNDVQKVLGVSDASITNYFDELEREGKVRQIGEGSATYYELR